MANIKLLHYMVLTGLFIMVVLAVPILFGNLKLLKKIRLIEPGNKLLNYTLGGWFTNAQVFPFLLLFGKYKVLSNNTLKQQCEFMRILFVAYITVFSLTFLSIILIAILKA